MERWMMKSAELLLKLSFLSKKNPAVIPYSPQKCDVSVIETPYFKRVKPEKCGVSSDLIYDMIDKLENEQKANLHNLLVLKDGEIICECSAPGYDVRTWHLAHSMSKSITGLAVGLVYDDGLLDINKPVYEFFPEYTPKDKNFKKITVKHLLTMQSGIAFNEAGSVSESFWTRAFIESKVKFTPGTLFGYNSMNSYMLGHIVARISGTSLLSLVENRIFAPLGITNYYWEKGPEGIEKGGWGLYLSSESWAKIGLMMLNGGVFNDRRIISEDWIKQATSAQVTVTKKAGDFNYGYQIWVSRSGDSFLFNGMLGQNVWMCPKNNVVVSMSSENNELFQKSAALAIVREFLSGELSADYTQSDIHRVKFRDLKKKEEGFYTQRRWIYPIPESHGIGYRLGFKSGTPYQHEWDDLLGKYAFPDNNQGLLPLFIRAMQNNYTGGLESVSFHRRFNTLFMTVNEGGKEIRFEVGLYDYVSTILEFDGEKYITRVLGSAIKNQEGEMIYKIEFIFPEMPNSRKITMRKQKGGTLSFFMEEVPNHKIAEPFVESLYATNPKLSFIIGIIEKRLGDRYVENKLKRTFSPQLFGVNVESTDYHRRLYTLAAINEEKNKPAESAANIIIELTGNESTDVDSDE